MPVQVQVNWQLLFNAGCPPIMTVGDPGVQDAGKTGTQGTGVSTPLAADVAAATCGLLSVVHIPKGRIFVIGILSMMVPAGILLPETHLAGKTVNWLGVIPKLQVKVAPEQTSCAIDLSFLIQIYHRALQIELAAGLQIHIAASL
jgi:hypothetical protein